MADYGLAFFLGFIVGRLLGYWRQNQEALAWESTIKRLASWDLRVREATGKRLSADDDTRS